MDLTKIEEGVRLIISGIGDDRSRPGVVETPERVARAYTELFRGYNEELLTSYTKIFEEAASDEMVVVKGIQMVSFCEHHLLPYTGTCTVGYIPLCVGGNYRLLGLSKVSRIVRHLSARLTIQERLTVEIAEYFEKILNPVGIGVRISASHTCASIRGAREPNSSFVTTSLLGKFRENSAVRAEFLAIA